MLLLLLITTVVVNSIIKYIIIVIILRTRYVCYTFAPCVELAVDSSQVTIKTNLLAVDYE